MLDEPQSLVTVYFIVVLPVETPVTTPLEFTVATVVPRLLHTPPASPLLPKLIVEPVHTDDKPLIVPALAIEFIITGYVTFEEPQLLLTLYFTVTEPAVTPVTIPPEVMVAEPVPLVIDHVPPAVASVNAGVDAPAHTLAAPPPIVATAGTSFTVKEAVTVVVPQSLLTE